MSLSPQLLAILRCPVCVRVDEAHSLLESVGESWLVCQNCARKYPIRDDIPVMLIDEGTRWQSTPVDALPVQPPEPAG